MPLTADVPSSVPVTPVTKVDSRGRIASVDALRGFDMFWIIGADALFYALNKLAGGDGKSLIGFVATQLDHVQWEGFRFYDLIFPLFVFIVGVSIVFSLSKRTAEQGRGAATAQIFRRALILYLFGLFTYDGIAGGWEKVRLLGVLQRIALCYLFTALAFLYLKPRALVALCASLLIGYWALMTFVPVPGVGAGNFAEGKNLANYVDKQHLPLFKWDGDHDPEGLLSTLPAIASCLLGVFAGLWLRGDADDRRKVKVLLLCGAASVVVGILWGMQFPVIKKLWTSSFVLVAGGFSAMLLGTFYLVIDVWKKDGWARPFIWIGTNAITIYMLVHVVELPKLAERVAGGPVKAWLDSAVRPGAGDLLIAIIALFGAVLFCRFLYRRRIFLKV
ncbi:MAG TPA: heparan-alpha-glucosaminide N-acetyltransferase domain-containing protein [Verrucomicrobiae bacterium]